MCGIFGYISNNEANLDIFSKFEKISKSTRHRGPDAHGIFAFNTGIENKYSPYDIEDELKNQFKDTHSFIGHHRLSIIDLEDRSNQPMRSEDQTIVLSYNGEIYNYIELRNELIAIGAQFNTTSDTEVLLRSFQYWGKKSFEKLNGDFAFCIYDQIKNTFYFARDRTGIKPLFFFHDSNRFIFSSELKTFRSLNELNIKNNDQLIYKYLIADFPNTFEHIEETFFKNIYSVKPGYYLELDINSFSTRETKYYKIQDTTQNICINEQIDYFSHILEDAVRIRTRADVPIASFLSGGLDSTTVSSIAKEFSDDLVTYSTSFPNSNLDETENIIEVANFIKVKNKISTFEFHSFLDEIEDFVKLQDQPFMTMNVYSQYKNIQFAKKDNFKVLLDGGGADEILGGYNDYLIPHAADMYEYKKHSPTNLNIEKVINFVSKPYASLNEDRLNNELYKVSYINKERRKEFSNYDIDRALPKNYKGKYLNSYLKHALHESIFSSWMNKNLHWDNRYLDLNGMVQGVEIRVPFQDFRIIDFAMNTKPELLINSGYRKFILRLTAKNKIPNQIRLEKNKVGFEFPICQLIQENNNFYSYFKEVFSSTEFNKYLGNYINQKDLLIELEQIRNKKSFNYNIWRPMNLFLFLRN